MHLSIFSSQNTRYLGSHQTIHLSCTIFFPSALKFTFIFSLCSLAVGRHSVTGDVVYKMQNTAVYTVLQTPKLDVVEPPPSPAAAARGGGTGTGMILPCTLTRPKRQLHRASLAQSREESRAGSAWLLPGPLPRGKAAPSPDPLMGSRVAEGPPSSGRCSLAHTAAG